MTERTILVAGQRLENLQAAGHVTVTGELPEHLGRCVEQALLTIALETAATGLDPYNGGPLHPMNQLLLRVGCAETG